MYMFEHKHTLWLKSPAMTPLKGVWTFALPLLCPFSSRTNPQPPPRPPLRLASVCQSGVRGVSLLSGLSCCFVESGGLWGVSTGDHCGRTSFHRRCTGMASLRSGNGGVATVHQTWRTCQELNVWLINLSKFDLILASVSQHRITYNNENSMMEASFWPWLM